MKPKFLSALLALGFLFTPTEIQSQDCSQGEISHIFVDNHSIFDPETLPEDDRIRWAYVLANRIHVRTRESFIRRELLLEVGDCYDADAARESARVLRDFRFIANADVYGVPQADGSVHLVADTRDEWTTKVALGVSFDDGPSFDGASITEENLLGRGILLSFFHRERQEIRDSGGVLEAPRVFAGSWDVAFGITDTRVGTSWSQVAIRPFVAEETGVGLRQQVSRSDQLFTFHAGEGSGFTHVVVPVTEDRAELSLAVRFGEPGRLYMLGGGISWEALDFHGPDPSLEVIPDGDFDRREPAPESVRSAVAPQLVNREARRVNVMAGLRRLRFMEWRGLDAITGVQDVPFGLEAGAVLGHAISGPLRADGYEEPDAILRGEFFHGRAVGDALLHTLIRGEGRRRSAPPEGLSRWGDILAEAMALSYWRPGPDSRHLLVARLSGAGGWRHSGPFQLTLGGEDGIRGLRDHEFPGGRKLILSLEDRITLDSPLPDFADLGVSLFTDVGVMQAGGVPFGRSSGVQAAVGAGLRIGFPAGTSSVIRVDATVPVTGDRAFRGPMLRISSREILGLLAPLGSVQLQRSRRAGVGTEFSGVAIDPYRR